MSELEASFGKLLGRQPTDEDRQQLYRVRDALQLKDNDALWLVLMALQHYQTLYAGIPDSISEAAKAAAGSSAAQAQSEISTAVAALVPTVENAVGKAATAAVDRAVNRIQWGRSVFTVWLAMIVLGMAFGFGWLSGAHVWLSFSTGGLSAYDFWDYTGWGIGAGIATPVFLILGFHFRDEGLGWMALAVGFILAAVLIANLGYPVLTAKPAPPAKAENPPSKETRRTK